MEDPGPEVTTTCALFTCINNKEEKEGERERGEGEKQESGNRGRGRGGGREPVI